MNPPASTPPASRPRSGGIGKGCLTGIGLVIFLALALVAGGYWGVQHLRQKYTAPEPIEMPEQTDDADFTADQPLPMPTNSVASSAPVTSATAEPTPPATKRWKAFEKSKDPDQNANIILSASEINSILSSHSKTSGKVFVSIQGNIGHVRVSIPLPNMPMLEGRYLNGEADVESAEDGSPNAARITNIVLNNEKVSDSVLDRRLFGWRPIRSYISQWLGDERISFFKIQDNKVIAEKSGGGGF